MTGVRSVHALILTMLWATTAHAQPPSEYVRQLSLDSLLNVEVSTAARHGQTVSQAPASVTIVTAEDIARHGYRTIADVIDRLPGFHTSDDRNYSYVGVRGFSRPTDYNNRVLLLLNGHAINEGVYGAAQVGTELGINLAAIERIEVVRGPASALYGTSAMLAVINLITKEGVDQQGGVVRGEAGPAGSVGGGLAIGRLLPGQFDVHLSGSVSRVDGRDLYYPEFDAPETNGGWAEGLDWERAGNVLGVVRRGGLALQGWYSRREKGVPTASWGTRFNDSRFETLDAHGSIALSYERPLGTSRLAVRAFYDHYDYNGSYPGDGWLNTDSTDWNRVGAAVQLILDPHPAHRVTAGLESERHLRADYRSWTDGEPDFVGDFPFTVAALYAQHEMAITQNLTMVTGLRHDARSGERASTTPRLALLYSPSDARTLKLLYGEAFRTPGVYERHFAVGGFRTNPDLGREHVRTFEVVLEQRLTSWLRGDASVYYYRMHGLIDPLEDEAPVDEESIFYFANRGAVEVPGAEIGLTMRLPHGSAAYASYAYQRARDERGSELTNSPAHLAKLGGSTRLHRLLELQAEARSESGRLTVAGERTRSAVIGRVGVAGTMLERLRLWITVENVFDTRYATPAGVEHVQVAIPQDGRALHAGMELRF